MSSASSVLDAAPGCAAAVTLATSPAKASSSPWESKRSRPTMATALASTAASKSSSAATRCSSVEPPEDEDAVRRRSTRKWESSARGSKPYLAGE